MTLLLFAVAGCGGGGETGRATTPGGTQTQQAPATAVSRIAMSEYKFTPPSASVKEGATITVANQGALGHDLRLRTAGKTVGGTPIVAAAKQTSLKISFAAGTYEMYCSVPGHEQAGMKGTLTVQ